MTIANTVLIVIAAGSLVGCARPVHSGMSFGELRDAIRSEISIGMTEDQTVAGLRGLRLSSEWRLGEDRELSASVAPKGIANPFDWGKWDYGMLRFHFDDEELLAAVLYSAPRSDRKQYGGWWSDGPVVIIGVTP